METINVAIWSGPRGTSIPRTHWDAHNTGDMQAASPGQGQAAGMSGPETGGRHVVSRPGRRATCRVQARQAGGMSCLGRTGGRHVVSSPGTGGRHVVSRSWTGGRHVVSRSWTGGRHVVSRSWTGGRHVVSRSWTGGRHVVSRPDRRATCRVQAGQAGGKSGLETGDRLTSWLRHSRQDAATHATSRAASLFERIKEARTFRQTRAGRNCTVIASVTLVLPSSRRISNPGGQCSPR